MRKLARIVVVACVAGLMLFTGHVLLSNAQEQPQTPPDFQIVWNGPEAQIPELLRITEGVKEDGSEYTYERIETVPKGIGAADVTPFLTGTCEMTAPRKITISPYGFIGYDPVSLIVEAPAGSDFRIVGDFIPDADMRTSHEGYYTFGSAEPITPHLIRYWISGTVLLETISDTGSVDVKLTGKAGDAVWLFTRLICNVIGDENSPQIEVTHSPANPKIGEEITIVASSPDAVEWQGKDEDSIYGGWPEWAIPKTPESTWTVTFSEEGTHRWYIHGCSMAGYCHTVEHEIVVGNSEPPPTVVPPTVEPPAPTPTVPVPIPPPTLTYGVYLPLVMR